jgi:hypothetical protein
MMVRALRRTGLALARADRVEVALSGSGTPASDAVLRIQLRWLEIVGREPTMLPGRRSRLSLIPASVAVNVSGQRWW